MSSEARRIKCPDCPDGQLWDSNGPTSDACLTCAGSAWVWGELRLCSFCENRAATVGKYCPACAQLADDTLDEIAGGPGEFEKMLAKHLAKGARQ